MPTNPLKKAAGPTTAMTAAEARRWGQRAQERGHRDAAVAWFARANELDREEAANRPIDGKMRAAGGN